MDKPQILVTLGSNGYPFPRLIQMLTLQPLYADTRVSWFIQCGNTDVDPPPADGTIASTISRHRMEELVQRCSLVISHCGIGSINMMLSYRKRVCFVPRVQAHGEFSDDHQLQIAAELKNPRMDVVLPGERMPTIGWHELVAEQSREPIDITDYSFAALIKERLLPSEVGRQ